MYFWTYMILRATYARIYMHICIYARVPSRIAKCHEATRRIEILECILPCYFHKSHGCIIWMKLPRSIYYILRTVIANVRHQTQTSDFLSPYPNILSDKIRRSEIVAYTKAYQLVRSLVSNLAKSGPYKPAWYDLPISLNKSDVPRILNTFSMTHFAFFFQCFSSVFSFAYNFF